MAVLPGGKTKFRYQGRTRTCSIGILVAEKGGSRLAEARLERSANSRSFTLSSPLD